MSRGPVLFGAREAAPRVRIGERRLPDLCRQSLFASLEEIGDSFDELSVPLLHPAGTRYRSRK